MPTAINDQQPYLALTRAFVTQGVFPPRGSGGGGTGVTLDMVRTYGFNFAPGGTLLAQGQILPISQNTAVFSLVGTFYGGNGTSNFAIPNLGGRVSVASGQGPGLSSHVEGQIDGTANFTLLQSNLPTNMGGSSSGPTNLQPTLSTNYYINGLGIFPGNSLTAETIGVINEFAGNFAPNDAIPCDGRLLPIAQWDALFAVIGTTYGGDGVNTFAVPDLRGRVIVGAGQGSGLTNYVLGQSGGSENVVIGASNVPAVYSGGGAPVSNIQPYLALNQYVALTGLFPSQGAGAPDYTTPFLGEIITFAGTFNGGGDALAAGQLLPINQNQALFSLFGTTYGGNGTLNFALPDLRGRVIEGWGGATVLGERGGTEAFTVALSDIPDLTYSGTPGNDRLLAGDGTDTISGLAGNDTIFGMGGIDTLNGNDGNDVLIGGSGNDILTGGNNDDVLLGQDGDDTLDGGTGLNTIQGGLGNDIYIVSGAGDTITELLNEGTDLVQTALASFTLSANVENLTFTGAGAFVGAGNALNNVITGGAGFNVLVGGDGNDTLIGGVTASELIGGLGNDIYVIANAGDTIVENPGEGTDTVQTALASYTLRPNVENLNYTGAGAFTGTGNAANNVITGGNGNDILFGLDGADTLNGGAGADRYSYVGGETGVDTIVGFVSGTDRIVLSLTGFVHTAQIEFFQGAAPVAFNANSTFLYNSTSGIVSYDPDGTGAGAAIQLANIGTGLTTAFTDFIFF
jgi:microcystin-dependent protein